MLLTEKNIINPNHKYYNEIDELCFLSKNLYNKANYIIRQEFIKTSKQKEEGEREFANYLNYYSINKILKKDVDYISLPRKVSNQTLMNLDKNWKSFFKSIKDYSKNPNKYNRKPNLPKYKNKTKGRNILIYELGAISKKYLKDGIIKLSQTNIEIPFINKENELKQVRIIPNDNNYYKIEIIYEKSKKDLKLNKNNKLNIDLGVNNLMTLTSNKKDINPIIVNGRSLKSTNQYFNKLRAEYQSELPPKVYLSKRIKKLTQKRNNKIENELHNWSKFIINYCISNNIGTIVIGKNNGWKNESKMGKVDNQKFINIPFNKLISQIIYKSELVGITIILTEESYTSKASFLNLDPLPVHDSKRDVKYEFNGYRIKRGLYKIKGKDQYINSDVNGSYNIGRKVFPEDYSNGIEGFAVNPIRVKSINEIHNFL